ncbi:hypothetical protein VTN02DRAFT_3813 [Thermoascus thermophilus]
MGDNTAPTSTNRTPTLRWNTVIHPGRRRPPSRKHTWAPRGRSPKSADREGSCRRTTASSPTPTNTREICLIIPAARVRRERSWTFSDGEAKQELAMTDSVSPVCPVDTGPSRSLPHPYNRVVIQVKKKLPDRIQLALASATLWSSRLLSNGERV